ncbi:HAMP domain-containing histidine kinase [bacterium]|nr:HAMP domain-containing histidine kinase [bacterium]
MKWFLSNKIAILTSCGFLLVILFLWLDEVLDLPALLFGAARTPINLTESIFETVVVFILAILVLSAIFFLDKKVEDLNREKSKILSIISHDLRNIFTGLVGNTRILSMNPEQLTPDASKDLAASIQSSSKRMATLMNNLINWSRLNSGFIAIRPIRFNLATAVQNTILILHNQANTKNISLSQHIEPHITVLADKDLIDSVIHNLLHNAVKFTPREGKITVQALEEGDFVKVFVSDNGVGLSQQEITHLCFLEPGNTRRGTEGEKGSGLGMYICRKFIQCNRGIFHVESRSGQGTTISFTLPRK